MLPIILIGLTIFGLCEYLSIDPTYGGIAGAAIIGILIGKLLGKGSEKYAFFSIFMYNLIAWIFIFLFTSDGKIALQYGGTALYLILGFLLIMFFVYSIIGFFAAFVASNMCKNKQGEKI